MAWTRSQFVGSTGYVAFNSANFFTKPDINIDHMPVWKPVLTSHFGPVDEAKGENIIKINLRLWGAYENLTKIMPSYLMNPIPGTEIFGSSDIPLTVQGRNNDLITYTNCAVTGMAGLYLGVDNDLFAADLEFTALIANGANPEDAGAYHTRGTNAYSDATAAFAKANYKSTRFDNAWGAITGFTAFKAQKGIAIGWKAALKPKTCDGLGTINMTVSSMVAEVKMIPVGPTLAQLKTNSQEESAMGTLASTISADMVMTGANSGPVLTAKSAFLAKNSLVFGDVALRVGEAIWRTTRGFSAGVPAVVASAA